MDPPTFAHIKAMQAAGHNSRDVADAMRDYSIFTGLWYGARGAFIV
jgi:hypothetical protein